MTKMQMVQVDDQGRPNWPELKPVIAHLLCKAFKSAFPQVLVAAILARLGIVTEVVNGARYWIADDTEFGWTDCRYGDGGPFDTLAPENGQKVVIRVVEGKVDGQRFVSNPDRGYSLVLEGDIPQLDREMVSSFFVNEPWPEGSFLTMRLNGACEVAKMLGYKPRVVRG